MISKEIKDWIKTILISVVLAWLISTFIARPTIVKLESMYPTLEQNHYLILEKITYRFNEPERGDIVVFESPIKEDDGKGLNLIKRVIGVEGDHIVIKEGHTYINGEKLDEEYINGDYTHGNIDIVIPENHVFVMGDNRPVSLDSRADEIGSIDTDTIQGKVLIRLFPFNKIGTVE